MYVTEYLKNLVVDLLGGDVSRFDELWVLVPDFSAKLRSFNSDGSWLHWSPKTFDGWYCVPSSSGFDVYYQERGLISEATHFSDEREAIKSAIDASVFSLGQSNNSFKPKPLRGSA
ncbi:hypothetical protein [Pseudorhodoferax sp. Leaf265]|uniref:hypothetical protein n=1 Tax=Pseudorhodoferax sp. Leaf265 TaxID=1736315 RepID=UPI0006FFACF7|nr:hypothetical protein [Pseudorhodoferax sp. Leaf265]KQP08645.1 hypothetical protein ASF45_33145 [Pseudorhodoferax sp. Leaf265]